MKKLLAILLTLLMLASLSVPVFADGEELFDMALPQTGITLHIPWEYLTGDNTLGVLELMTAEEVRYNSGIYYTQLIYVRQGDVFDPDACAPYLTFLCLRNNCDQSILNDPAFQEDLPSYGMSELKTVGDYTHYVMVGTDNLPDGFTEEEISEYFALLDYADDIIYNADYYEPEAPQSEMTGKTVSFETQDLDGNPVSSAELFAANRITMLNIWETGCGACKGELGELAQIHGRLQAMGCGIVGLLWDSDTQEAIDMARQLLADAGTSYTTLRCPSNFDDLFELDGFPTSFFIDSSGQILGAPILGAQVDRYEMAINDLLDGSSASESGYAPAARQFTAEVGTMKVADKAGSAPTAGTPYRIICVDESGSPVAGATVQFCSDTQCMMGKTDENGVAVFEEAPGHYTVHLLKVPQGFAKDSAEYEAPELPGDLTIVVKAG